MSGAEELQRRARAWIAAGRPAVAPELAATVMLVRDALPGPEVFVQVRAATMAFAPAMAVFPGGRVDAEDARADVAPDVIATLAEQLGVDPALVRRIVGAAVREVHEEAGVRLAPADLRARAHWITPAFEPRRFDTWFFACRLPSGQVAVGRSRETTKDLWGQAEELLAAGRAGRLALMPPTVAALEQLASFGSVADFLADRPTITTIEPRLVATELGYELRH